MKPLTILVAEDDLLSRMVLERSVVQWGHQLVSATDGEAARELLQTRKIDICILDWEMPLLSGVDICQWVRAGHLQTPPYMILITSKEQPEDMQAAYEAGADDYLTRPCDLKYLRRRINTVAGKMEHQETGIAGLSPLDIYLSDLRLMRRKS